MIRSIYIFLFALLVSCNKSQIKDSGEDLPNILFFFADDFTFDAIHALGNDIIETPNLDRMVLNGTHFNQAFNRGEWNGNICVALRAMIITGKTIWSAKIISDQWGKHKNMEAIQESWGKLMENKGYQTYMAGK